MLPKLLPRTGAIQTEARGGVNFKTLGIDGVVACFAVAVFLVIDTAQGGEDLAQALFQALTSRQGHGLALHGIHA